MSNEFDASNIGEEAERFLAEQAEDYGLPESAPPLNVWEGQLRPAQALSAEFEDMVGQWQSGVLPGYSTPFAELNKFVRMLPTELWVVAARPSMGKTAFAMQLAEHVAQEVQREEEDGAVVIFSAETAGPQLYARMVGARANIEIARAQRGEGSPDDYRRLLHAAEEMRNLPFWVDDSSSPSTDHMLRQLSRLNEAMTVKCMLFDFLELAGDDGWKEESRIASITANLKAIARKLEIPVVAISQLNRAAEGRANHVPGLHDLRQSGMVEQLADVVLLLMRPEYYISRGMTLADVPLEHEEGVAYLQVAKNRNGPVGRVLLAFESHLARFADLQTGGYGNGRV